MGYLPTILVVDDDPVMQDVLSVQLEDEGYRILRAENGSAALDMARHTYPDLVLLDVMMPGMDGYEVCRRLRRDPLLAEIPVVMITSLDDRDSRIEGLRAGADDFLAKPYDGAELRARVGTITRLNRYRRLHEERTKLDWVVERASDGYLMLDEDDRVVYSNARARRLLDLGEEEENERPRRFIELAARRFRCQPEAAWAHWPELTSPLFLLRAKNASKTALWLRVEVLDLPGGGARRLVRLRDESEPMALGRSLWKLGSLVEHRLSAPLEIALGSLEMLASERRDAEATARLAELALRSGRRLEENVRRLTRFLDRHDRPWERGLELDRLPDLVNELGTHLGLGHLSLAVAGSPGRLPLSGMEVELLLREILDNLRRFHPRGEPSVDLRLAILPPKTGPEAPDDAGGDGEGGEETIRGRVQLQLLSDAVTLTADELARTWVPYYRREEDGEEAPHSLGASMVGPLVWGAGGGAHVQTRDDGGIAIQLSLPLL